MRARLILATLLLQATCAWATTLEQLSVDQMIQQSTAIVRAKVTGSFAANRNGTIYTYYRLQVTENLKSTTPSTTEVAVPGGMLGRVMQSVAGAPTLKTGGDYVLFLWTSRSGLTQIIGLSQGAFDVKANAGSTTLLRSPIDAQMLDAAGRVVSDNGVVVDLSALRSRLNQLVDMGGRP
ncbi:MAG: hypothetical protein ABIR70_12950 [Bryobacteraceae bacterium]